MSGKKTVTPAQTTEKRVEDKPAQKAETKINAISQNSVDADDALAYRA